MTTTSAPEHDHDHDAEAIVKAGSDDAGLGRLVDDPGEGELSEAELAQVSGGSLVGCSPWDPRC